MDKTNTVKVTRRVVQPSTTLNRKYVKRPTMSSPSDKLTPASVHPLQASAIQKMNAMNSSSMPNLSRPTAQELKERAIQKALSSTNAATKKEQPSTFKPKKRLSPARIFLALACATVSIFAVAYLIKINMPDVSLKVTAMQSGIDATYPNYIPRGYKLAEVASGNNEITLKFRNSETGITFELKEEKSSWDSAALLNNYVKRELSADFVTIREQGLTIYVDRNYAAWVNGGIVYKIALGDTNFTKKQIKSIAVSL